MLVLSRKSGDSIVVDGRIVIHVVKTDKETVKIVKHREKYQYFARKFTTKSNKAIVSLLTLLNAT